MENYSAFFFGREACAEFASLCIKKGYGKKLDVVGLKTNPSDYMVVVGYDPDDDEAIEVLWLLECKVKGKKGWN
jgi:hypothetical protein